MKTSNMKFGQKVSLLALATLSANALGAGLHSSGPGNRGNVTLTSTPAALTNSTQATFGFTGTSYLGNPIANFNCSLDGAAAIGCTSPFVASTSLSNGAHSFVVSQIVGNISASYSWTVDTTPPTQPVVSSNLKSSPTNQLPTVSFSSSDSVGVASYSCEIDQVPTVSCKSPLTITGPLKDGSHTFQVKATDTLGNVSSYGSYTWVQDTVLPTAPVLSGIPASFTNQTGATISIQSTDTLPLTYSCTLDGQALSPCLNTNNLSGLANGKHTFTVVSVTDTAGNVQTMGATASWSIDTLPPTVSLTGTPVLNQYGISDVSSPEFTILASDSGSGLSSVNCILDSGAPISCVSGSFTPALTVAGQHSLVVIATDKAGNKAQTNAYQWNYVTLASQIAAATSTAQNNSTCTGTGGIGSFYWEIGNANSGTAPIASGAVVASGSAAISRTTTMDIDSASKFIFGTYAVQALAGTTSDPKTNLISRKFLQMASGYNTFQDDSCDPNYSTGSDPLTSVLNCYTTCCAVTPGLNPQIDTSAPTPCAPGLKESQIPGGDVLSCNNTYTSSTDGTFYYSGGHFERFAVAGTADLANPNDGDGSVGFQMGSLIGSKAEPNTTTLASTILGQLNLGGLSNFAYNFPQMAGGVNTSAADYATILQDILGQKLQMYNYLGTNPICAWKAEVPGTAPYNCPSQYSPIVEEADTYSMGHWVESDPVMGDGAFSSPGKDGFYPWIDQTKNYYGIISRQDTTGSEVGFSSLVCGRQIRIAFMKGVAQ